VSQEILFRKLVQERGWTTVETFNIHLSKAAGELAKLVGEPRLAEVVVSRRSFDRWMRGDLTTAPQRHTRRVLEYLFEESSERLFQVVVEENRALRPFGEEPVESSGLIAVRLAAVDPSLVPHWNSLLQILAASHNVFGPNRIHGTVAKEMHVIREYRQQANGGIRVGLLGVESRWAEFASWTAENLGSGEDSTYWLGHALDLAREGGDAPMEAYVLMRQAQRAAERHEARTVRNLADAAWAVAGVSDRDRALSAVRQAQGHALAGESRPCYRAIETAYQLVARADEFGAGDDLSTIGHHCVRAYVQAHEAYCRLLLGHSREASQLLVEALASWPADFRQDEHLARSWLALAYAAEGRIAEAATEGTTALSLAPTGGSVRVLRSLRALDRQMAVSTGSPPEASQFHSALALLTQRM